MQFSKNTHFETVLPWIIWQKYMLFDKHKQKKLWGHLTPQTTDVSPITDTPHYTSLTSDTSSFSKVLRNDVMSHVRTMESLNQAGRGLLEVGSGESPHGLQSRLEQLNESWEFVRCETERRQLELENRLSQVKNTLTFFTLFHLDQM